MMRADPVHAGHRDGGQASAAVRPGVDQQVLHRRPARQELLGQVGRRPGPHRVPDLVGQSRPRNWRRRASRTTSPTAPSRRSTPSSRPPARRRSTPSATASAAPCWRPPWPTWPARATTGSRARTFFTTMLDFSEPGELGVFIDEGTISYLEQKMAERGYLDGAEMAGTFNMLRENDLIWSFVINNYLLGNDPFPFDLLYWNSDSTRMPYAMHSFYLRNFYQNNKLVQPGGITLAGVPIDLAQDQGSRRTSCPPARITSRRGRRPTRGPRSSAARTASRWRRRATSPASSTRRPATSTATGPTPRTRRTRTNGWPTPSPPTARGGRTGTPGPRSSPARTWSRPASPAPAS